MVLGFALHAPPARADDGSEALSDCQPATVKAASFKHSTPEEAATVCEISRKKLGFELQARDVQKLIDAAAVASLSALKRGFELRIPDAAINIAEIIALRGMASDRDNFDRTAEIVASIDIATEGVVSPAVFLIQLHASGPAAKTMSDEGIISFASMVSLEEKRKVAMASYADQQPTSASTIGGWGIAGHVLMDGHVAVCFMSRATKLARGEFVYSSGLAAASSVTSIATITVPTSFANGARPNVTFKFDGDIFTLPGQVVGDEVRVDLSKDIAKMAAFIKALTHSKAVQVSIAGRRPDTDSIDLADAAAAFDANGVCLHDAVVRATAEMARRNGGSD